MIASYRKIMNDDDKGKQFLELINQQNNLQWSIVVKLSSLVNSKWSSTDLKNELESLVEKYSQITKELNSFDSNNSIL